MVGQRVEEQDGELVGCEIEGGVGIVTLRRPPANALGDEMIAGLDAACDRLDAGDVGVAVVRSVVPRFFAAGADLKLIVGLDRDGFTDYVVALRAVLRRISTSRWLSIATVEGHALGGGLELALACTLRVAGSGARLGVPEVKLGLLPGATGTQQLTRLIGRGRALDLLLSGRSATAEEAYGMGLVDRLVDQGSAEAEARQWAAELAEGSRTAQAAIVRCVDAARDLPFEEGLEVELRENLALFESDDGREGVAAFIERRPARFGGR